MFGGTSSSPSLSVFNGRLRMAWKGVPNHTRLFVASSGDGVNWTGGAQVAVRVGEHHRARRLHRGGAAALLRVRGQSCLVSDSKTGELPKG
jgi:hypothetical protein